MELLPSDFSEFRSQRYWDKFFRARKGKTFEWYGEWQDLEPLLRLPECCGTAHGSGESDDAFQNGGLNDERGRCREPSGEEHVPSGLEKLSMETAGDSGRNAQSTTRASSEPRIFVPGCGNSELSARIYSDLGHRNIVNVDFSKVVIEEMKRKHASSMPDMQWLVRDMTATGFTEGSFDVVLDKGCLDALMGEEGKDAEAAGGKFLAEAERLVNPAGGRYLCVTLAQRHVLELLLATFRKANWEVKVFKVPLAETLNPKQNLDSPSSPSLHPFLVLASSVASTQLPDRSLQPLQSQGEQPPRGQIPPVAVEFSSSDTRTADPQQIQDLTDVIRRENALRAGHAGQPVCDSATPASAGHARGSEPLDALMFTEEDLEALKQMKPRRRMVRHLGGVGEGRGHRFSATVLDCPRDVVPEKGSIPCAVFLVPQGREHEWLFSSEEGQWELASSAKAQRLILISLSRRHTFGSSEQVQDELSPLVLPLAQARCREQQFSIPYMTTGDGIGWRRIRAEEVSDLSGRIIVEDVESSEEAAASSGYTKGARLRRMVFERNLGLVQSEAVLRTSEGSSTALSSTDEALEVDHDRLANDYHVAMLAGLALISQDVVDRMSRAEPCLRGVVVGLGGGALPMFLRRHFPFASIQVAELDQVVHSLAKAHFGFAEDHVLNTHIADGASLVAEMAAAPAPGDSSRLDLVVVDADSDDAGSGMSCPAPVFLGEVFLEAAKQALRPEGMLQINVVARSKHKFMQACQQVQKVFPHLFQIDVDGDVNRVLCALPTAPKVGSDPKALKLAAVKLVAAASRHAPWGKGPSLVKLVSNVQTI